MIAWVPAYDVAVLLAVFVVGFTVDEYFLNRRNRNRSEIDAFRRRNAALRRARRRLR